MWVVLSHLMMFSGGPSFLRMGECGVDVFFVLSGFLIHRSFRQTLEDHSFLRRTGLFFVKRVFRIVPPFIVALLITVSIAYFTGAATAAQCKDAVRHLLTLTYVDVFEFERSPAMDFFWSLNLEELFYLAFPFLFPVIRARGMLVAVLLVVIVLWVNYTQAVFPGRTAKVIGILLGVKLASIPRLRDDVRLDQRLILATLVGLPLIMNVPSNGMIAQAMLWCFAVLLVWLGSNDKGRLYNVFGVGHALTYLGNRAYSLYLLNVPVILSINYYFADTKDRWFFATLLLLVAGDYFYRRVERPSERLGKLIAASFFERAESSSHNSPHGTWVAASGVQRSAVG